MNRLGASLGRLALATAFASTTLAAPPSLAALNDYPLKCTYVTRSGEREARGRCARLHNGDPWIDPTHLARMVFKNGLAEVRITSLGIAYVRRDGRAATVFLFDNGADYFAEGLARGLRQGKLVYYNRRLRAVIVTGYDWGEPFHNGRAAVCVGCVPQELNDGHSVMIGGRWGVIDRRGRLVVPLGATPR